MIHNPSASENLNEIETLNSELIALLKELSAALPDGWWQRNLYYSRSMDMLTKATTVKRCLEALRKECDALTSKLAEYERVSAFIPTDDRKANP